jgi:hypothetical protein
MFDGEDITLRDVTVSSSTDAFISAGRLRRVRESKDAHRKGKFTATSLAVQALFSSTNNAQTRKFLRMTGSNDKRPQALSRLGKSGSRKNKSARGNCI